MKYKLFGTGVLFALLMGLGSPAGGQETGDEKKRPPGPKEFIDRFNERFENQEPQIGAVIEDLKAFDENGKKINFNDFRGKFTVLTFGCLT